MANSTLGGTVTFGSDDEFAEEKSCDGDASFSEFAVSFSKMSLTYAGNIASTMSKAEKKLFTAAKAVYTEHRTERIDRALDVVTSAHNYDMVFLVDCTCSMEPFLENVKAKVVEMVKITKKHNSGINLQVAFVGYRDFDQQPDMQFEVIDFMTDITAFQHKVSKINIGVFYYHSDYAEDVFGGMQKISRLSWRKAATKVVHHFADAPSHGYKYHNLDERYDQYISLDPPFYLIFTGWRKARIRYVFYRITEETDKMIEQFRMVAEQKLNYKIDQVEVADATQCLKLVADNITSAVGATITTELDKINKDWESVQISTFTENQSTLEESDCGASTVSASRQSNAFFATKKTQCRIYNSHRIESLRLLKHAIRSEGMDVSSRWVYNLESGYKSYKIRVGPEFGRGKCRSAFKAKLESTGADSKEIDISDVVLKRFLKEGDTAVDLDKRRYAHQAVQNNIANFLAGEFNQKVMKSRISDGRRIRFVDASVLILAMDKNQVWNCEEALTDFRRFTTNSGSIANDHDCTLLLEFSKWTYDFTDGFCMVADLQGMYDDAKKEYILTDPVIMATNVTLFGSTNLGPRGMKLCYDACENYLNFAEHH